MSDKAYISTTTIRALLCLWMPPSNTSALEPPTIQHTKINMSPSESSSFYLNSRHTPFGQRTKMCAWVYDAVFDCASTSNILLCIYNATTGINAYRCWCHCILQLDSVPYLPTCNPAVYSRWYPSIFIRTPYIDNVKDGIRCMR